MGRLRCHRRALPFQQSSANFLTPAPRLPPLPLQVWTTTVSPTPLFSPLRLILRPPCDCNFVLKWPEVQKHPPTIHCNHKRRQKNVSLVIWDLQFFSIGLSYFLKHKYFFKTQRPFGGTSRHPVQRCSVML